MERSSQPTAGATRPAIRPAVAIEPSIVNTLAPAMMASATAAAGVSRHDDRAGQSRPRQTAAAPPALPAEGMTKPRAPSVRARVRAIPRPRALNVL